MDLVRGLNVGVPLTNLDKFLYEEANLRKAEVLAYYACISPAMIPHVKDRPLTLVRCPNGHEAQCFFQKHAKLGVPDVVRRISIGGENEPYLVADRMEALVALAQLGVLEFHTWPCHASHVERPDQLIFDLDPSEELAWSAIVDAARELRERLRALGLESFVKTTGGKGLHVVAPVLRELDWDSHKAVARAVADAMAADSPQRYLTSIRKDLRKGRIFIDYLRNGRGATAVAPYSTRARAGAPVATPLDWAELDSLEPPYFNVATVLARIGQSDPWTEYQRVRQRVKIPARSRRSSA
jgi:bifunctional non-homologous end joining protein LigD